MSQARPFLATYLETLARSLLFSLGLDHALSDFLVYTAVGTAAVLLAILVLALRVPRRRPVSSGHRSLPHIPK
jgi:hypothetical protein